VSGPAPITQPSQAPPQRPEGAASPRRRWLFVLYCALIGIGILEVLVRFVTSEPIPYVAPSTNERLVYELNPERREFNRDGMRGPEIRWEALDDAYVIAVIGDSHAFSSEVRRYDRTFPARLEADLRSMSPERSVVVLNFGVPGYNTAQELELFQTKVMDLAPDLVILQFTINDSHVCNYLLPAYPRLNALFHRSELLVFAWKKILYSNFGRDLLLERVGRHLPDLLLYREGLVGTLRVRADDDPAMAVHPARRPERVPARYHYMLGRENWEAALWRFGKLGRTAGIELMATGVIEATERGAFEAAGFEVLSFQELFAGLDMLNDGGYDPARTSDHFDERGSAIIGSGLARAIGPRIP
jgi:hypothetical protein